MSRPDQVRTVLDDFSITTVPAIEVAHGHEAQDDSQLGNTRRRIAPSFFSTGPAVARRLAPARITAVTQASPTPAPAARKYDQRRYCSLLTITPQDRKNDGQQNNKAQQEQRNAPECRLKSVDHPPDVLHCGH